MLAGHHRLEQIPVVPGERIESAHPVARSSLLSCGQRIELLDGRRRVVNDRQSFQVSGVGLPGDFQVAEKIGHTFAHRHPLHDLSAFAADTLSDFESLGVIDDHLDAKNRTGLVDHFQPVLFNTMLDARTGKAPAPDSVVEIGDHIAGEIRVRLLSQEAQDFLGAKTQSAVAQ